MKYNCYQDCSVIHGWFVYCAFCWQMHRLSKSLEIRFRMTSFSKMGLLTCPCLRRKRVEKSQAILEHLMTFRSSISTGKPEQLLSLMFFFSVSWSRAYGLCGLSLYRSNDLTYNSTRFKKPLDIIWPHIQRKGSEEYLVMILAVNRKLWAIFLPRVYLEKEQTPGAGLKHKYAYLTSWFSEKHLLSILLFVNENYCLQGRSQEETTTEANTRSVVRNQPYEIF